MKNVGLDLILYCTLSCLLAQTDDTNKSSALVMSMTQRSLVMPGYQSELKALIAKQAYDFWKGGKTEPYVAHLNVYSALHDANKYLGLDSVKMRFYNQVGIHSNKVTDIKFGSNPNFYYTSSADGTIVKWDKNNPETIPEVIYQSDHIIKSIEVSDDGQLMLATFYKTGLVLISLDQEAKNDITTYEDSEPIQSAIFVPGEQKYLSVTDEGVLVIKGFNLKPERVGKTNLRVNELIVDKKDGTIYAGTGSGTLEAWEKPYEVEEDEIKGVIDELDSKSYFGYELGSYAINALDISPDGRLLAIGRERGDVILWNLEKKEIERVISSHKSAITDIDFSPRDRYLLTTSRDKTARLWDLDDSRKLPIILDDHDGWVFTGSFDLEGKNIITGSGDQYIRTWPVNPQVLAERICLLINRNMTSEEWAEFIGSDIQYMKTCSALDN